MTRRTAPASWRPPRDRVGCSLAVAAAGNLLCAPAAFAPAQRRAHSTLPCSGFRGKGKASLRCAPQLPLEGHPQQAKRPRYLSRFRALIDRNDPRMLLPGIADAKAAEELLKQPDGESEESLRWAQRILDATRRPGGHIPRFLRNAAFPIVSIPLVAGFLAASTNAQLVGLQLVNQTWNALFNRAHAAKVITGKGKRTAWRNFIVATAVACFVAVEGNRLSGLIPAKLGFLHFLVPYFSVVSADFVNVTFTRWEECTEGVLVVDAEGKSLGTSRAAGRAAVVRALLTRSVLLPAVALLLPPLIMAALRLAYPGKLLGAVDAVSEVLVVALTLYVAFPACTAIFPETLKIPAGKLEDEVRARLAPGSGGRRADFNRAVYVYRGL
mmetsp:Transcript_63132/g.137223  ORF Transcript_63132/g.137223 Transcript_63132/m.137223 type:complete len:383 (-) Transcript_63132:79-1227(-)